MRFSSSLLLGFSLAHSILCGAASPSGIQSLVQRRLPNHVDDFTFTLSNATSSHSNTSAKSLDTFTISNGANDSIAVSGNSVTALASGLRWYMSEVAHLDVYWFIGSRLHLAPSPLPRVNATHTGQSIVPWKYHFNTVTFSYTSAFWTWEDWELQLDWMALHGINLPLAWVGFEKILYEVFLDAGFSDADILSFLSGPAFQSWNRFGNIQGSWDGDLPMAWINSQHDLQKQIVARMVELGMTPVLPSFAGFVPRAIETLYPNASFVNGSQWEKFPSSLTNTTFIQPTDDLFSTLQSSFISKQAAAYGNVSSIYTLDQFNENSPSSGDLDYLRNISYSTWQSLKKADPNAIWLMQGWLFYSDSTFWSNDRIEAFLSGVTVDDDMLILDLYSESSPQWQRTNSYYGKPWLWCQLHGYGGNMGLYGQVTSITQNPIEALANSTSLVGFGLTMEGQEGNEIMYDLLLDQSWSAKPLDVASYFHQWAQTRYGPSDVPQSIFEAWDILGSTVYNNTNLTAAPSVTKSIFELSPNTTGLLNVTGHHPTTITYNPKTLAQVWSLFYNASATEPALWDNPAYVFDLVDITRQVMANAFYPLYTSFVTAANSSVNATYSPSTAAASGKSMLDLLSSLDCLLLSSNIPHFSLPSWIAEARAWASPSQQPANASTAGYFEYNARNQITLWGPTGQVNDYASKQWGGLIGTYYVPRWTFFVETLLNGTATAANGENAALKAKLLAFEEGWQTQTWGQSEGEAYANAQQGDLPGTLAEVVHAWPSVFGKS